MQGWLMYHYCVLILILYSTPLFAFANKPDCDNKQCIAVIDAGSSGSRLHIYSYDLDPTNTPLNINEIWLKKVSPGISIIKQFHGSITDYMDKLFSDVPVTGMPVYFYSTAGMRLLSKTDQDQTNQAVTDWFASKTDWQLLAARTITGKEEGLFAWIALNYHLSLLNQKVKPLVGIIEIGGASTQIVFPLKDESSIKENDKLTIDLYGQKHSLFSHSFLGLGQNEMEHQYLDEPSCYPKNFELPSGLRAQGDAKSCKNEQLVLINTIHKVERNVTPVLMRNPVEQWYLLGGLTQLLNDKILPNTQQQFNNEMLMKFADKNICQHNWPNLEATYPNNLMLFRYCLLVTYLNALMVKGYGIEGSKNINFLPIKNTVDWTLGVVLIHK
jgi:apyrase